VLQLGDDLGFRKRYDAPERPWTEEYLAAHTEFLEDMLDSPEIGARFAASRRLPRDYGVGLDERVVEYPWLFSREPKGRVLDAGSTLNHAHILDRVLDQLDALHVVTLAPEERAFVDRGVSYLFADLRELPIREGYYDTVVSLSTLEHVGMDNSQYGGPATRADDPRSETMAAVRELRRVLRPGGRLLASVPYGQGRDHRSFRQFDCEEVRLLFDALEDPDPEITVYAYSQHGWELSDLASKAEYRDYRADPRPVEDKAAAARAVACIAATPAQR
jgi:SAM-dependent methyltransferase